MPQLFDPIVIRDLEIKNRVWVSPMCQYSAKDGVVGEWHHVHLGSFATGGAGLIVAEATGVVPEGRISIGCPGIYNDEQVAAWKPIVDFAHSQGSKIGIQLAHAGRKAGTMAPWSDHRMATPEEGGWQAVAPSAIAFEGYPEPRALTILEIQELVKSFGIAARRSIAAGFDLVEIHAAHGYLAHEFYSPLSNAPMNTVEILMAERAFLKKLLLKFVPVFQIPLRFSFASLPRIGPKGAGRLRTPCTLQMS